MKAALQWWAEVMGWEGTWQLIGLCVTSSLFLWAAWSLGRWEGRMAERRTRHARRIWQTQSLVRRVR